MQNFTARIATLVQEAKHLGNEELAIRQEFLNKSSRCVRDTIKPRADILLNFCKQLEDVSATYKGNENQDSEVYGQVSLQQGNDKRVIKFTFDREAKRCRVAETINNAAPPEMSLEVENIDAKFVEEILEKVFSAFIHKEITTSY